MRVREPRKGWQAALSPNTLTISVLTGAPDVGETELVATGTYDVTDPNVTRPDTITSPPEEEVDSMPKKTASEGVVAKSTLPLNAFMPTSIGVSRKTDPGNASRAPRGDMEEEEEEITPMAVHRDHQGYKLAAPSLRGSAGRTTLSAPRKLDEQAKRDLQSIMSKMTTPTHVGPVRQNGLGRGADSSAAVSEEEIVPVKLTRRETELAQEVLSSWAPGASKTPAKTPPKSGFHKAVGALLDFKHGRAELPSNSAFLTTMGVSGTPTSKGGDGQDVEEAITPMAVHKDHLGNKHYAPSPAQSTTRQPTKLPLRDSTAKEDIASVLSAMPARSKAVHKPETGEEVGVEEESIVPTVLTREQSRIAEEALSRWVNGEGDRPKAKPSPFQRLVGSVMDTAAAKVSDDVDSGEAVSSGAEHGGDEVSGTPGQVEEKPVQPSKASDVSSAVKPSQTPEDLTQTHSPPSPVKTEPKPKPRTPSSKTETTQEATEPQVKAEPSSAASATATTAVPEAARPVPAQRNQLRAPVKIAPLSAKPFARVGALSVLGRGGGGHAQGAVATTGTTSSAGYGKTRSEDSPFLVEVLKGIVGLGIKVKVNNEGRVEVTEVQSNSPVGKNGNVK